MYNVAFTVPIVLAVSTAFQAAPIQPFSADDWRSTLSGTDINEQSLTDLSVSLSNRSTELIRSGRRDEATRITIASYTLSKYISRISSLDSEYIRRLDNSLERLKSSVLESGVSQSAFDITERNLVEIIGQPTSLSQRQVARASPPPRSATQRERTAIIAVIRQGLIDPTSPIFGPIDIIGDKACATVNSKNRYGGYTGNQEAILAYDSELREWALGGIINMPHSACLAPRRR